MDSVVARITRARLHARVAPHAVVPMRIILSAYEPLSKSTTKNYAFDLRYLDLCFNPQPQISCVTIIVRAEDVFRADLLRNVSTVCVHYASRQPTLRRLPSLPFIMTPMASAVPFLLSSHPFTMLGLGSHVSFEVRSPNTPLSEANTLLVRISGI
jgi:hypothetical protein